MYPFLGSEPMDLVTTAPAPWSAARANEAPVSPIMPEASMVGLDILIPARFTLREVILPPDALSSLNATEPFAMSAHGIHGAFDPTHDPGQDA